MRKQQKDRRSFNAASRFPLADRDGCIIPFNRSTRPDRRMRSYRVEEIDHIEITASSREASSKTA